MARLMPEICEQRGHSTLFLRDVKGACCITEVYNGSKIRVFCTVVASRLDKIQPRTQSPQALWPAVGRLERLWGTGILLPHDLCGEKMQAVTRQPESKKFFFFRIPKEPEDSGYEIR